MTSKAAIVGAALLMLGASAANAGPNWIGLSGGAGIPTGTYGDAASTGWNLGATATHKVNDSWGFGGDLSYHSWNGSEEAEAALPADSKLKYSAMQATGHGIYNFNTQGQAKPYAKFGAGLYHLTGKLESPSGSTDSSENDLGFNFGGGINFLSSTSNRQWGFSGAYHLVQAGDSYGGENLKFVTVGLNMMWGPGGQ